MSFSNKGERLGLKQDMSLYTTTQLTRLLEKELI